MMSILTVANLVYTGANIHFPHFTQVIVLCQHLCKEIVNLSMLSVHPDLEILNQSTFGLCVLLLLPEPHGTLPDSSSCCATLHLVSLCLSLAKRSMGITPAMASATALKTVLSELKPDLAAT